MTFFNDLKSLFGLAQNYRFQFSISQDLNVLYCTLSRKDEDESFVCGYTFLVEKSNETYEYYISKYYISPTRTEQEWYLIIKIWYHFKDIMGAKCK